MARRPLNLTRDQLASFLKDPEQIKQFENLFASARNPQLAGGASGSIPYQSGDTETTFLPIGTPGQVLQVNPAADAPEWGAYTGTGDVVRATGPSLSAPNLGTPASGTLTNCVGLPIGTGVSGLGAGVATFLGTPSSENLATAVTDETGTGALVFGTDAALTNPTITNGRATGLDYVGFDNTPTLGTVTPGTVYWDDGNGTLNLNLKGGNVDCLIGEQEYARVYNDTASTLTKGQVVYISGAQGNRVAVKLAQADSDANSAHTIGFVAETIAAGGEGWVQISGPMYKLNTLGTIAGDTVYLSPTTPGLWTTTKPVAPNHLVVLGFIERVHDTVGSIFIKVDNGYELDELHNVKITSVANNDILQYDSTGPFWKNVAPSAINVGTATDLSGGAAGSISYQVAASDTTFLPIGTAAQVLKVNSGATAPEWVGGSALTKTDDTNVTLTIGGSPANALLAATSLTLGWTGTLAVARGGTGTGTAFTAGSVVFAGASGTYSQNNANFFWDNTNNRLGIGTTTPSSSFDVLSTSGTIANLSGQKTSTGAANTGAGLMFTGHDGGAPRNFVQIGGYKENSTSGNYAAYFAIQTRLNGGSLTERMRVDSSGNVLVNTTSSNNLRLNQKLAVVSAGSGLYGGMALTSYVGATVDQSSLLEFQKSRGSTDGSYTVVANGDVLGYLIWRGADGSAFQNAAAIRAEVDAVPGAGDMPGRLVFLTTTDGTTTISERMRIDSSGNVLVTGIGGLGYGTGSGGAVTQATSRTTGVTLNKTNGAITLVSAAGTTAWQSFTVTNGTVAATDTVIVSQKSGTDLYMIHVTNVSAGSFQITFATTGGTTTEQPVFNFAVIKAVTS